MSPRINVNAKHVFIVVVLLVPILLWGKDTPNPGQAVTHRKFLSFRDFPKESGLGRMGELPDSPGLNPKALQNSGQVGLGERISSRIEVDEGSFRDDVHVQRFCAAFRSFDARERRAREFEFCLGSPSVAIASWYGVIREARAKTDGKYELVVVVKPAFRSAGVSFTPHVLHEHWEWDGVSARLLHVEQNSSSKMFFID